MIESQLAVRQGIAALVVCCLTATACVKGEVPEAAGKDLSDQFVRYITSGRLQDAYSRMEAAYKRISPQDSFEANIQTLLAPCGKAAAFAYSYNISGVTAEYNGAVKPYRKYYYDLSNGRDPVARCYIAVEIVPDGDHLAVSAFSRGSR